MEYSRLSKKLLLFSASLLMITGLSTSTVLARHVHHHRYYIVKQYHHYHRRNKKFKRYQYKYKYKHKHFIYLRHLRHQLEWANNQGSPLTNEIRDSLFHDINESRQRHHRRSLRPSLWLQHASNYRSPYVQTAYEYTHRNNITLSHQASVMWAHGYDTHTSLRDYVYHKSSVRHHLPKYYGENVCDYIVGGLQYQTDGTLAPYNNDTSTGVAANINNDLMYHDTAEGNNNGHRKNELNKRYRYLGIGVKYNPTENYGTITEDFSS